MAGTPPGVERGFAELPTKPSSVTNFSEYSRIVRTAKPSFTFTTFLPTKIASSPSFSTCKQCFRENSFCNYWISHSLSDNAPTMLKSSTWATTMILVLPPDFKTNTDESETKRSKLRLSRNATK